MRDSISKQSSDEQVLTEDKQASWEIEKEIQHYAKNANTRKAILTGFSAVSTSDEASQPSRVLATFELFHGGKTFQKELPVFSFDKKHDNETSLEDIFEDTESLHDLSDIEFALPLEVSVTPTATEWGFDEIPKKQRKNQTKPTTTKKTSKTKKRKSRKTSPRYFVSTSQILHSFILILIVLPAHNFVVGEITKSLSPTELSEIASFLNLLEITMTIMLILSCLLFVVGVAERSIPKQLH